jgi:hypothetical protein
MIFLRSIAKKMLSEWRMAKKRCQQYAITMHLRTKYPLNKQHLQADNGLRGLPIFLSSFFFGARLQLMWSLDFGMPFIVVVLPVDEEDR